MACAAFMAFCILQRHILIHPHIPLTHLHLIFLPSLSLWPRGIWFGWARDKRDVSACGSEQTHLSFLPFFSPPLTPLLCLAPLSSPLLSFFFPPLLARSTHLFRLCDGWVQLGAKSLSSFSRRETLLYLRVMERGREGENGLQMLSRSED